MSNCATKADFKETTVVDTCSFATKPDLAILKGKVDKTDIKLKNVLADLSSLTSRCSR